MNLEMRIKINANMYGFLENWGGVGGGGGGVGGGWGGVAHEFS